MQDIELYRQLKLIHTKKDNYAKYLLTPDKSKLILDVERYLSDRNIRIQQISQSKPFVLPKIKQDQEESTMHLSKNQEFNFQQPNRKSFKKRNADIHLLPDIRINIVKRSMIDDKTGNSKFFLTALQLENNDAPHQKFKSISKSVWIFLSFFRWIAANAKIKLQWSWTYDPATYLYKNPFKNAEHTAIDFAITQNSSNILECYSGWLREDIRSLLRIHPSKRKDRDIDLLMKYFSTMKSFKKYNAQSRREFLSRGEYNSWGQGRHIIKEGYPALALYFILDGEVVVSKMKEKSKPFGGSLPNSDNQEGDSNEHKYKCWDGSNMLRLITLFSGDSFGEVAFTMAKDHTRQATVTTLKKTEFLLVEIHDATNIIKTHNDNAFARKIEFISTLPLLQSLRVDAKTLAYYCTFKSVSVNVPLLIEGENSPNMYFIRSGDCRLLKTVKIKRMKSGSLLLKTLDGSSHFTPGLESDAKVASPFVDYHLIVVGQLREGDHFGEGGLDRNLTELTWFNGAIGHGNSRFSVVTNCRTEIMSIPKAELHRFATEETWTHILRKNKEISKQILYQSYEKVLKWTEIKNKICRQLKPHYSTNNADYI